MAKLVLFRGTTLQTRVRRVMLAVVAGVVVVQAAFSVSALRDSLLSRARFQGAALARALAADPLLRANLWAGNAEGVAERLDAAVLSDPDAVFAAVIDGRGQLTLRTRARADSAALRSAVLSDADRVGDTQISRETLAQEAKAAGAMNELGEIGDAAEPAAEAAPPQEAAVRFAVGTDTRPAQRETTLQIARSGALALVALGAAWGALAVLFGSVFRRIERTKRQADELAAGDLSTPIRDEVDDEIGTVANSIESIRAQWARIVGEIRHVTRAVVEQHNAIGIEAGNVAAGAQSQVAAAAAARTRAGGIVNDSRSMADDVAQVAAICRTGEAGLAKARAATTRVSSEMDALLTGISGTSAHHDALTASADAIGSAAERLGRATHAAVRDVDDVHAAALDAASKAGAVAQNARTAVERSSTALQVLARQVESTAAVEQTAARTAEAAAALDRVIADVLQIAGLITEIAELTSLLSLNASIIAAQAGDRALGFGTVASEIRSLAARTHSAARDIARRTDEAGHQVDVVSATVQSLSQAVDEARATTHETSSILHGVLDTMNAALTDVGDVARRVGDAATRSRAGKEAVARVDEQLALIDGALARHREAGAALGASFDGMRRRVADAHATGAEQIATTEELISAMTAIAAAAVKLVEKSSRQTRTAADIAAGVDTIGDVANRQSQTVTAIQHSLADLHARGERLSVAVATLRVSADEKAPTPPA